VRVLLEALAPRLGQELAPLPLRLVQDDAVDGLLLVGLDLRVEVLADADHAPVLDDLRGN
jgi:hypothetical protein